jgi:hypothetical protein
MARLCKPESLNCPNTGHAAAVFAPSGAVPAFEESLAALWKAIHSKWPQARQPGMIASPSVRMDTPPGEITSAQSGLHI